MTTGQHPSLVRMAALLLAVALTACGGDATLELDPVTPRPGATATPNTAPTSTATARPTTAAAAATATLTATAAASPSATAPSIATATRTNSTAPTTNTPLDTRTPTFTLGQTMEPTATPTGTAASTLTSTPTQVPTNSPVPTATSTNTIPVDTPTSAPTATSTNTAQLETPTATYTISPSPTASNTATVATSTPSPTSAEQTATFTATVTQTMGGAVCGNGFLEPGEFFIDPGLGTVGDQDGVECAADAAVLPCTASTTRFAVGVNLRPAIGTSPNGFSILIGYRSDLVGLPGSGLAASVRQRITFQPPLPTFFPNDRDYALRVLTTAAFTFSDGPVYSVSFDVCQGAAPSLDDFACIVEGCTSGGGPITGCTCDLFQP